MDNWLSSKIGGSPYIGNRPNKRGNFFEPTVEAKRMPGGGANFETSSVIPVTRPTTLAEMAARFTNGNSLNEAETNHEIHSNFRVMHAVRDIGSKVTEKSWLEGHYVFLQSKTYASSGQHGPSPFEMPHLDGGIDFEDAFSYVFDAEEQDQYGAVRVMTPSYLNLMLSGERKRGPQERYPDFHSVMQTLGLSVGGIVNNQTGNVGPGYPSNSLRARDLVNLCLEGDVPMVPYFDLTNCEKLTTDKGTKIYAIVKRIHRSKFQEYGLTTYYVPDNGNPHVKYPLRAARDEFVENPFQIYFVAGLHPPRMDELEYHDDNGYLCRAAVFYIGLFNTYHRYSAGDARANVNDHSKQRQAGLITILYQHNDIPFVG